MSSLKGQKGLSLVEVTIMLLVLILLTGVLAPSIFDFVQDASWVKVKEDCEAISLSVMRLHRDVGCIVGKANSDVYTQQANCKYISGGGQADRIPNVLYSDGTFPAFDLALTPNATFPTSDNWTDAQNTSTSDSLETQLVTNGPLYVMPPSGPANPYQPAFNKGWRGGYLSAPIGPDPWGQMYLVNIVYLPVPVDGNPSLAHNYDTFCLSAGPNGKIETKFQQLGAKANVNTGVMGGDDFITIISGGTF